MKEELGVQWMQPDLFRIGASGLLTDIERQLDHHATGRYSAAIATRWREGTPMGVIQDILARWTTALARKRRACQRLARRAREPASAISSTAASRSPALCSMSSIPRAASASRACRRALRRTSTPLSRRRARRKPKWAALPGFERSKHIYALASHVQKRERFFSVLETIDNGKPIRESRDIDIPLVARHFYHHAGWASLIESEFPETKPVGVCGQIIPWNFPLLMLAWKIAPALAAGNTVVLKPAEFTPLTALAFAAICVETGLPPGVVNIVTGDGATGAALVAHAGVDKIAFTGSTEVGRAIRKATAGTGKKLSLELGGKSPFIVFEDADLDSAVEGVVDAIWFNQGQVCCAGSRLLVAESVADALYAKLRARMANLRLGDPLDKSTDVGAIVAPVQLERIRRLMREGEAEGLEFFRANDSLPDRGCFYPPTLVTGVDPASVLAREEIFGPVLVATTFRTPDEAVALANNTRYGLAASVWTENVNRALEVASRIKAGVVWINSTNLFDAAVRLRRLSGKRLRPRGRARRLVRVQNSRRAQAQVHRIPSAAPQRLARPCSGAECPRRGLPDRTAKLFIGGKQARPDSGYSYAVLDAAGRELGLAGLGNRKDIRNAVEAAAKASSWGAATAHNRAQVLYYIAENLAAREDEFAAVSPP